MVWLGEMARINVELDLLSDSRFENLSLMVGTRTEAIGLLVLFWFEAQRRWKKGEKTIPRECFPKSWLPIIECGFAIECEGGFYCKGAKEQFSWIETIHEGNSRGGKIRASSALRDEKGHFIQVEPSSPPAPLQVEPAPSSAPTPTPTLIKEDTNQKTEGDVVLRNKDVTNIDLSIKRAWEEAYGEDIVRDNLTLAKAAWVSEGDNPFRSPFPVYARRWFQNVKRDKANKPEQPTWQDIVERDTGVRPV